MNNLLVMFSCMFFLTSSLTAQAQNTTVPSKRELTKNTVENIKVLNFNELEPLLYTESDKIHIVNFWAMWCAPCVKELPYLEAYAEKNPNAELLLVSMDFPEDIDSKLIPFLKRKGIKAKGVLLDDPDANSWIDRVYPKWSGSIPFTIIFNKTNRSYHEKSFESLEDLENSINNTFNKQ